MRRLTLGSILVPAALLAGCGADTIQGPAPRDAALSVERRGENLAQTFTFTTFDVPGAVLTIAQGINARGDIVGFYNDAGLKRHGFLMRDGVFTTIDNPALSITFTMSATHLSSIALEPTGKQFRPRLCKMWA